MSREVASDGGGSSGDHACTSRRHGEKLASARNSVGCFRKPLFERRGEGLLEVSGVDTGCAKGGGENFVLGGLGVDRAGLRRGGLVAFVGCGPPAGTRQASDQLGHEAKRLFGAGKRAGEKNFYRRRAAGENVFARSGTGASAAVLPGPVEVDRRGTAGHTELSDHGADDAVDQRTGCERSRFQARGGLQIGSRVALGGHVVDIMSPPPPPR